MVKDVWYLVTHIFRCKATEKFYNHFEDSTALIFMQEQNSQILKAMLLKKNISLCWIGWNPGLNMLNFILPSLLDGGVCHPHSSSPIRFFTGERSLVCVSLFCFFCFLVLQALTVRDSQHDYKHARFPNLEYHVRRNNIWVILGSPGIQADKTIEG